jgi:hypothetical protein
MNFEADLSLIECANNLGYCGKVEALLLVDNFVIPNLTRRWMIFGVNRSQTCSVRRTEEASHGIVTEEDPRCSAPHRRQPRARIRASATIRAR